MIAALLSIVFLVISIPLPIGTAIFLWKYRQDMEVEKFRKKFESSYEGLKTEKIT